MLSKKLPDNQEFQINGDECNQKLVVTTAKTNPNSSKPKF